MSCCTWCEEYFDKKIDELKKDFDSKFSKIEDQIKEINKEEEYEEIDCSSEECYTKPDFEGFYKNTIYKVFSENKDLYNFDPDNIWLEDIVFGVVWEKDVLDSEHHFGVKGRYPFRVIYKDDSKIVLQGLISTSEKMNHANAISHVWDISLMINNKEYKQRNCRALKIDTVRKLTDGFKGPCKTPILATGKEYWIDCGYDYVTSDVSLCVSSSGIAFEAKDHERLYVYPSIEIDY